MSVKKKASEDSPSAVDLDSMAIELAGRVATGVAEALVSALGSQVNPGPPSELSAANLAQARGQFTCENDFDCWHFKCPKEIKCQKAFECTFTFTGYRLRLPSSS